MDDFSFPVVNSFVASAPPSGDKPLTEEQTKALFLPNMTYSLNCLYAELVVSMFLLGMFTLMLIRYWTVSSKGDNKWTKGCVILASLLLYGISAFVLYFLYFTMFQAYGTYIRFLQTDKYGWFPLIDALCSSTVQTFFAHRAFRLTGRNWFVLIILLVLIMTTIGAAAAIGHIFVRLPSELSAQKIIVPTLLWLGTAMVADIIITWSILYGLYKSRTGWTNTDRVIGRLIRMTLEAQVPPLLLAIAYLIEFSITPANLIGSTFMGIQGHLYCMGLLYSLNSRTKWKTAQNVTMDNGGETFQLSHRQAATIQVDVETETYETRVNLQSHNQGINRVHETDLAGIKDAEWDYDEKTETYGSMNSASLTGKIGMPTTRSETPNSGVVVASTAV